MDSPAGGSCVRRSGRLASRRVKEQRGLSNRDQEPNPCRSAYAGRVRGGLPAGALAKRRPSAPLLEDCVSHGRLAHLYLFPNLDSWEKWEHHRREAAWTFADEGEEIPVLDPYTPEQVMDYIRLIQSQVDARIDALDMDEADCGFAWYKGLSRAELLMLNFRHISEHVGQMHELRLAVGLDVDWRATRDF